MKYIMKHPTGTYQLNLSTSLEDFKKKVQEGKDLLTLFNLDGTYAGMGDASYFDDSEITAAGDSE